MTSSSSPRDAECSMVKEMRQWLKETEQESNERKARLESSGVTKLRVDASLECTDKDLRHEIGRVFAERFIAGQRHCEHYPDHADQNSQSILWACTNAYSHGDIPVRTLGDRRQDVVREIRRRHEMKYPAALTGFDWTDPPAPKPFAYRCAEYLFFGRPSSE